MFDKQHRPSTWSTLAMSCWLALWGVGCELGDSLKGLAHELGNPDPETIEGGGRLIAEGHFRNMRFDGTTADGAFVVAIEDGRELAIAPFSGEPHCNAGPARRFVESLSRSDDARLDARIPFLVPADGDEPETLRFTNYACEVDEVSVPGGDLPLSREFSVEPGFIVQTEERELLFVSPWTEEKKVLAENARTIRGPDRALFAEGAGGVPWMWTIADGEVVAFDRRLREVFRAGSDIERVVHSPAGTGGPMLALTSAQGELSTVLVSDPSSLTRIEADACEPRFSSGNAGRELLYYSPCAERTLQVHELDTGTRREIRSGIIEYTIRGNTETGPVLLYITEPALATNVGQLWARWGQNEPIRLGDNGNLSLSRMSADRRAQLILDWDGNVGRLVVGEVGGELEQIAESVAYFSSAGVISDFADDNGQLQVLVENELQPIVDRVSTRGIKPDPQRDRALFLRDFDGTEGQLTLVESGRVRPMTKNVRPNAYQFTALLPMVTLLTELDEESNTAVLKMHRTDRDEELDVAEGVAETLEVAWPREGLLYSAPGGSPPGIYFARAL